MADGKVSRTGEIVLLSSHPSGDADEVNLIPGPPERDNVRIPQETRPTAPNQPQPPTQPESDPTGPSSPIVLETTRIEDTAGDTVEIVKEECDHGWYPEITIGLGALGVILMLLVVLLAIRSGNLKKQLLRKRNRRNAPQGQVAPEGIIPGAIQVGKLHQIGARESQQDCLAVSPTAISASKGLLAVVADGMGGLSDGDKMSQTAAAAMMNGFMAAREILPDTLLALAAEANLAVNRVLGPNQGQSGTTLVSGIVKDGLFYYVSVGDSRIGLFRNGMLTQLNREHVYRNDLRIQALNGSGTLWDAETHPKKAGLTSFLGMGNLKYVDIPAEPIRLCRGDKIILMSDGVFNALLLNEMEGALTLPAQQAADAMGQMIQAKAYRNQDNYTAVILEF